MLLVIYLFYSDDSVQICSCHNVTKGDVVESIKNGTCKTMAEVKSCTKAGTGCGGCLPLVQSIFKKTMIDMGQEVSNHCMHTAVHFEISPQVLTSFTSVSTHSLLPC